MGARRWPHSTYRVQLRREFDFDRAAEVTPYLARLGVTHVYCSPYLQAAPGSAHGYDVVDHSRLNRELGGDEAYGRLTQALQHHELGQLLDIVPNHMAVAGRENRWWWDVLENGPASVYAHCFDIDWWGPDDKDGPTVLAPVLGDHYGRILEAGEIRIEREGGTFLVRYHAHELPLSPRTLWALLEPAARKCGSDALAELAARSRALAPVQVTDPARVRERHRHKERLREDLAALCDSQPEVAAALDAEAAARSADVDGLDQLLRLQRYRVARWRTASEELDYRRFFNIESLVGLRVEDDDVFAESHRLVLKLVRDGLVDGLRIDHIDGLRDPLRYLDRLRAQCAGAYVVVEKILETDEALPSEWPVEGTSGYDFVSRVDNLFVASDNAEAMTACYRRFTDCAESYAEVVQAAKHQVMGQDLRAEVDSLARLLASVCEEHRRHRDHTRRELRAALVAFLAAFPVYRTYVQPGAPPSDLDRAHVAQAVAGARQAQPEIDGELLAFLGELALLVHPGEAQTSFALRLAQVSAPVMAKGVEDTAFYRYHRLISLNEVGGDPGVFGRPVDDFHRATADSARRFPASLLTLSTHDTKRSADVRARIHLLSELPAAWSRAVADFAEANAQHLTDRFPDPNAEYLLYQTLVGAWPIETERVAAFMEKATREAKVFTSWVDPDETYDRALQCFVRRVLEDPHFVGLLEGFLREQRLVERGRLNALAQTTLLLTCPGVPDIYQGSELWDLSLVDPDNRRPVDYPARSRLLDVLGEGLPEVALAEDAQGLHKLRLVSSLLQHRRRRPDLYATRDYTPLEVRGEAARHAVAFARGGLVVLVPRLVATLNGAWHDTELVLPPGAFRDVLTGQRVAGGSSPVAALLETFPVAVLQHEEA